MQPKKRIPVTGPSITQKEIDYVTQAARDGWDENHTKYVNLFEKKFSEYIGRTYALATSSCTGALHLACLAIGIKKGDEVIVPNATWQASIEPLYYVGATPIFVDIEPDTWCIDPNAILSHITPKTKAIIVVDLYGHIADMDAIITLAKKHNLAIIEDAAEAVGSEYKDKKGGSFGDVSCVSFHGSKTLVTGEGGMLLTHSKDIVNRARYFNDHCKDPQKVFWNLDIGYKYKMTNFQAACGLAQLERIDELLAKKRTIFSWYQKRLHAIPGVLFNTQRSGTKNSYWMVTIVVDKRYQLDKEDLMKAFEKYRIQTRPFFYPLSLLPSINKKVKTPVAFDISMRSVNLPCGQNISENDVDYICTSLKKILSNGKNLS